METEDNKPVGPRPVLVLPAPPSPKDPKPLVKLTKETLVEYAEEQLVNNAPRLLPNLFRSARSRIKSPDAKIQEKAFDQIASLYGYTKASPGIALNFLQQNNSYGPAETGTGFERIIRQLEKRDRPETDTTDAGIIDAEIVEEGDDD
jgi:hypothetical protein